MLLFSGKLYSNYQMIIINKQKKLYILLQKEILYNLVEINCEDQFFDFKWISLHTFMTTELVFSLKRSNDLDQVFFIGYEIK